MNTCYIVGALDCELDFIKDSTDLLIGADNGYSTIVKKGMKPDVVIGDFDSYAGEIDCDNVIKYPVKKDDTDTALSIKYAIENGYKSIVVYGAIGGMLDHTIANLQHLAFYSKKDIDISFIDGENVIFALTNQRITFSKEATGRISVFSFDDLVFGVTEKGLMYTLDDKCLNNVCPLGVSNEFIGKKSEVGVTGGTILVYTSKNNYDKYLTKH